MKRLFRRKYGFLYILLPAMFFMAMGDACTKYAGEIPLWEKLFIRGLIGLIPAGLIKWRSGEPFAFGDILWLTVRLIAGLACTLCSYYAVVHMDLAEFSLLKYLSPMLTYAGGVLLFHERIKKNAVFALLISFAGILLFLSPTLARSSNIWPYAAAAGAALSTAAIGICERGMGERSERPGNATTISVCQLSFFAISALPFLRGNFIPPDPLQWSALIGQAVFFALGQMMLTLVYQHHDVTRLGVYDYTAPVYSMLIGVVLFSEVPSSAMLLGSVLIIGGGILNAYEPKARG